MFGCVLVGCLSCQLFELSTGCLFAFALNVLTLFFFINLFFLVCQKSKNHIKNRKSKKFDRHCWVLSQNMFYLVLLCKWLCASMSISLLPLHLYHCGRNFEIFVTIVNRSSTLTWMISEWFCWSWDMHRLMSIYLLTLYFIVFVKRAHQM